MGQMQIEQHNIRNEYAEWNTIWTEKVKKAEWKVFEDNE